MVIKSTGSLLNVEGANEKELMNIDGKLCVVKRNLQETTGYAIIRVKRYSYKK